jgi:hypothetical protein
MRKLLFVKLQCLLSIQFMRIYTFSRKSAQQVFQINTNLIFDPAHRKIVILSTIIVSDYHYFYGCVIVGFHGAKMFF